VRPRVSVVIATRDRSALLAASLASVLRQRHVSIEVLAIDDGSMDNTPDLLAGVDDERVQVIRHAAGLGVSAARNAGVAAASGEWIAFCDDDDLWAPDKLRLQLEAAAHAECPWVYAGSVNVDLTNQVRGGSPPIGPEELVALLPRWNPMPGGCSNVIVRADTLAAAGGTFDEELRIMADWDLWLRLAPRAHPAFVARPLVGYRVHAGNMSLDARGFLAELSAIEKRYGPTDRARIVRHVAHQLLRRGQLRASVPMFARAAAATPPDGWLSAVPQDAAAIASASWRRVRSRLPALLARGQRPARPRPSNVDPNAAWKAEAAAWLAELPLPGAV
jgi:glycosyltransferase involved in cell wall biosynthesis